MKTAALLEKDAELTERLSDATPISWSTNTRTPTPANIASPGFVPRP